MAHTRLARTAVSCCLALIAAVNPGFAQEPADPDRDGDGLPDFWETHKYFTNPDAPDSDGDGTPDSDPEERREYTYSVRAVMHIMAPYDPACMNDDFQDARVVWERDGAAEIEFTLYPFNTCSSDAAATMDWRSPQPWLAPYLAPGPTNNFDAALQAEIRQALDASGIRPDGLTDRQFVITAARWFDRHARYEDGFTCFAVEFPDGVPRVPPDMQPMVDDELRRGGRTLQAEFERELLGAGMFRARIRGSCTSTAIYFSTCLRAVGIPTRTIICVPAIDASDPQERSLPDGLTHPDVRGIVQRAAETMGTSWASHTFNEVYIGGRWRRLNSDRLGQGTLDRDVLGLMVHVNTFAEMSEAGLIAWGRRNATRPRDICGHSNPYSCVSLSDRFGAHSTVQAEGEAGR